MTYVRSHSAPPSSKSARYAPTKSRNQLRDSTYCGTATAGRDWRTLTGHFALFTRPSMLADIRRRHARAVEAVASLDRCHSRLDRLLETDFKLHSASLECITRSRKVLGRGRKAPLNGEQERSAPSTDILPQQRVISAEKSRLRHRHLKNLIKKDVWINIR